MLKVVGASWYQTRISTYILIGAGMLVIGAFFVAQMERPKFDGTYCATAYWSRNSGFKIEYWKQRTDLDNIPKGVARICYKDSINENGWSQLEVETQRIYPDWVQSFAAGLLEGSLTWRNVYNQWSNSISSACDRDEDSQNFCTWARDVLASNYKNMKEISKKRSSHDYYWHQINLFYHHLEGLETGWRIGAERARSDLEDEIPFEDFLLLNAAADIQDLKIYFENFIMHQDSSEQVTDERKFRIPSASMLLKLNVNNNETGWQLIFGHSSAGSYSSMLRMQKRYKFHFHYTSDPKTHTVPGVEIIFTGYPGILASTDDFYVIKGRQVHSLVAGVAMKNENLELWHSVDIKQSILLSARVMAANRLAQSRRTWAKAMSRHPSTGSKQWVLIDLRKLNSYSHFISNSTATNSSKHYKIFESLHEGIFWAVEQLPGRLHAEDMTENVFNNNMSYWFANGTPNFREMLNASKILIEDDDVIRPEMNVTSLEEVELILRKRAFRGDLLGDQSIPYGNIDIKLFSYATETEEINFQTVAGPLSAYQYFMKTNSLENVNKDDQKNNELEQVSDRRLIRNDIRALAMRYSRGPFKWSLVDSSIGDVKHEGHPDEWNFDKISPKWAWYDN